MPQAILLADHREPRREGHRRRRVQGLPAQLPDPAQLAEPATRGAVAAAERRAVAAERAVASATAKAEESAALLNKTVLTIAHQAGDDGRLFGLVTARHRRRHQGGARLTIDKRDVHLDEPIKTVGTRMVVVGVEHGVTATVKTMVVEQNRRRSPHRSSPDGRPPGGRPRSGRSLRAEQVFGPLLCLDSAVRGIPERITTVTARRLACRRPVAPPQNLDAEQSVLGAVLLSDTALPALIIDERLHPEDFYREAHGIVFAAMLDLHNGGEPVDALTIVEHLKQAGQLDAAAAGGDRPARGERAGRRPRPPVRADRPRERDAAPAAARGLRHPGPRPRARRAAARARRHRRALDPRGRARGQPQGLPPGQRRAVHRARQARGALARGQGDHRHAVGLRGPGRDHGRLPARQPDHSRRAPLHGQVPGGLRTGHDPRHGRRRRLDEIVDAHERGEEIVVAALSSRQKLRRARVSAALRSGRQPLFRVTTKLGRQLDATANHPLLTVHGWRELRELGAGDRIAVARTLPSPSVPASLPDHELVLLAALIADGNLTQSTPRFAFGPDSPVVADVAAAAEAIGARLNVPAAGHGTATLATAGEQAPIR